MENKYEVQTIPSANDGLNYRVTEIKTDSRVATCYAKENADLVCRALNALDQPLELQSKLEVEMLNFLNWYTRLNSTDKVSVWSKDGQYKGLFNKDNEQMVEGYFDHLRREAKKVMIEKQP
jgi:hypothetical protein